MSLNRYAKQRDANESEIVAAMEAVGATVVRLDEPTDLLVGFRHQNFLIECKLPPGKRGGVSHSHLTESQMSFFAWWRGQREVARTPHEALVIIGAESPTPRTNHH